MGSEGFPGEKRRFLRGFRRCSDKVPKRSRGVSDNVPRGPRGVLGRGAYSGFPGKAGTSGKGQEWSFRFREALLWVVLNFRAKKKFPAL